MLFSSRMKKETKIYYVYDRQKLKHKIETINKSDSYNGEAVDSSIREKFAVTSYEYYSDEECRSLGYLAKGLVKSVTDPDGNGQDTHITLMEMLRQKQILRQVYLLYMNIIHTGLLRQKLHRAVTGRNILMTKTATS